MGKRERRGAGLTQKLVNDDLGLLELQGDGLLPNSKCSPGYNQSRTTRPPPHLGDQNI